MGYLDYISSRGLTDARPLVRRTIPYPLFKTLLLLFHFLPFRKRSKNATPNASSLGSIPPSQRMTGGEFPKELRAELRVVIKILTAWRTSLARRAPSAPFMRNQGIDSQYG